VSVSRVRVIQLGVPSKLSVEAAMSKKEYLCGYKVRGRILCYEIAEVFPRHGDCNNYSLAEFSAYRSRLAVFCPTLLP